MTLVKGIQFKNTTTEEIATITEVNDKYKTVIVKLENGKSMTYSFSTIKDKRHWIPVESNTNKKDNNVVKCIQLEVTDENEVKVISETEVTIVPTEKPVKKRGALIEWNGKAQNICAWGKELGISPNTLYGRIFNMGWSVERAFTTKKGGK